MKIGHSSLESFITIYAKVVASPMPLTFAALVFLPPINIHGKKI